MSHTPNLDGWAEVTSMDEISRGVRTFMRRKIWSALAPRFELTRNDIVVARFESMDVLNEVVEKLNGEKQ